MINIGSSRKGGTISSVIIGIVMFFGSFVLLWWNEGNAVAQFKTIGDLAANTVEASADRVDAQNESKPVYLSANANTTEELADQEFDVSQIALRLRRKAQMYQWEEDERKDSDSNRVTYSYSKTWSEDLIRSDEFNEGDKKNPSSMPFKSQSWTASDVSFGEAFQLPKFLVNGLSNFQKLPVQSASLDIADIKPHDGGYYIGGNPDSPVIGDLRISFDIVLPGPASMIAEQKGNSFKPWQSPKTGREIHKIMAGTHSKAQIIQKLVTEAKILLWILRGVGFLVMFLGLLAITKPLSRLAGFVPILGTIVESGIALVAFLVAGILTLTTIVIAWIAHRPLVGIGLLVVVGVLAFLLFRSLSKGKAKRLAHGGGGGGGGDLEPPPLPSE